MTFTRNLFSMILAVNLILGSAWAQEPRPEKLTSEDVKSSQEFWDRTANNTVELFHRTIDSADRQAKRAYLQGKLLALGQFHSNLSRRIAVAKVLGDNATVSSVAWVAVDLTVLSLLAYHGTQLLAGKASAEAVQTVKKVEKASGKGSKFSRVASRGNIRSLMILARDTVFLTILLGPVADAFGHSYMIFESLDDIKKFREKVFDEIQATEAELAAL